ncbi:MAG: orotate phosphoribosyltransferase [Eubacteriales bacterium]|nr:orotate phosphoribosyltransferase [Eubacteriales bacterium]
MDFTDYFIKNGAIKKGHFIRSSGRHTDTYVQCARLFENASTAEFVAKSVAERIKGIEVDLVMSAAIGGLLPGYEVARQLKKPFIFCERNQGTMTLRRDFEIPEGSRILLIEDEITTGTSIREMTELTKALNANAVAVACLVDKSGGKLGFGIPLLSLASIEVQNWTQKECPVCNK